MAATPLLSELEDVMARQGNDTLNAQAELNNPLWDALSHDKFSGGKQVVNVVNPTVPGVGFIPKGGARQQGGSRTPVQGYVLPKFIHGTLLLDEGTLQVFGDAVGDACDYMQGEVEALGATFGATIGSALYGAAGQICRIVSATAPSTSNGVTTLTITVPSIAGFNEGTAYEIVSDVATANDGDGYGFCMQLVGIALSASGVGGVLTFKDTVPGITHNRTIPTFAQGDYIFHRGSKTNIGAALANTEASGDACESLDVICSASATLHELTVAANPQWVGSTFEINGAAATQEVVLSNLAKVNRLVKKMPNLLAVGSALDLALRASSLTVASSAFGLSSVGNTRKMVDQSMDKYGAGILDENSFKLGGVRVMRDMNISDDVEVGADGYCQAFAINTNHLKIGIWREIAPHKQGGDLFLVDHDNYAVKAFYSCGFKLICNLRRAHCKMIEIAVTG